MLVILMIGLLGTIALVLAISIAILAWDEEPSARNLRMIRERAAAEAHAHADLETPAYADLEAAA